MCVKFTSEKPIILRKPRTVWKRVRRTIVKGQFKSRLGGDGAQQRGFPTGKTLVYTIGRITCAAEGSPGIYVYTSKPRVSRERDVIRMEVPAGAWFRHAKYGQATAQCVRAVEAL